MSSPFSSSSPVKVILLIVFLIVGTLSVVGARRWYSGKSAATPAPGREFGSRGASAAAEQRRKILSLKLTRQGFAPSAVTAPKGEYFLTVHNATGLDDLELRLDRASGGRERSGRVPKGGLKWKEYVELRPGSYVLTEASHPGWVCHITITPQD